MFDSQELQLIKQLIEKNIKKVEGLPDVHKSLSTIVEKIEGVSDLSLPTTITKAEIIQVTEMVTSIENNIRKYTSLNSGNNLVMLETIKKEITHEMSYLSSFRDKFIFELEFLDEVFKKEFFSQLTKEIALASGVSVNQAEKLVNTDEKYKKLRRDLHSLKLIMGTLKTKYTFFEKSLQLIIQSVSVAGKELHNSRMEN